MPGNPNPNASTRFQPGHKSIGGRPKGLLTPNELKAVVTKIFKMKRRELYALLDDENTTMLDLVVGKIIERAADQGDAHRMEFVCNRALGRVRDLVEEQDDDGNRVFIIKRPDGSEVKLGTVENVAKHLADEA